MAVKKESRREHNPVKTSRRRARARAAQLAPLEERISGEGKSRAQRDGSFALETGELKLPEALMVETETRADGAFRFEPFVIFILACALAYIAFIVYLIATGRAAE
jgi:hypothetical protein